MKRHTVMPETQTEFCFRMPIGSVSNDSNVKRMENQKFGGIVMRTLKEILSRDEERQDLRSMGRCYLVVLAFLVVFIFAMSFIVDNSNSFNSDFVDSSVEHSPRFNSPICSTGSIGVSD